jgi:hypothetical protein
MESSEQRLIAQAILQRLDILINQNEKLLKIFEEESQEEFDELEEELEKKEEDGKSKVRAKEQ